MRVRRNRSDINKASIINILDNIKPGLSKKSICPILSCYCFDGDAAYTFNGEQAVITQTKLKLPKKFGVDGSLFYKLIAKYNDAIPFEITSENDGINIQVKKSKVSLKTYRDNDFLYKKPDLTKAYKFTITHDFLIGLQKCQISMSLFPLLRSIHGIAMVINIDHITLYSTNETTFSKYIIEDISCDDCCVHKDNYIFLPYDLVKILVSLIPQLVDKDYQMYIANDYIYFDFGEQKVYSKLSTDIDFPAYNELDRDLRDALDNTRLSWNDNINDVLDIIDRCLILNSNDAVSKIKISLTQTGATFESMASINHIIDTVEIKTSIVGSDEVTFVMDGNHLRSSLSLLKDFTFSKFNNNGINKIVLLGGTEFKDKYTHSLLSE